MFLVVYLPRVDDFTVIPMNWIHDFHNKNEKFLNYGINANQLHVFFWTDNLDARSENGAILDNYEPDFNATFDNVFPAEGCYLCYIIKARGNSSLFFLSSFAIKLTRKLITNIFSEFHRCR